MDSQRFDDLVRTLSTDTSRRRALKGATALGVGSLLGLVGRQRAGANPRPERGQCPDSLEKCGHHCCNGGEHCHHGRCVPNN
jgi:hypothetical protein